MKDDKIVTYKIDEKTPWTSSVEGVVLPKWVADILSSSHDKIGSIVDIELLESWETNLFKIFARATRDYIWWLLWSDIDPVIFSQMTETLNKHRAIMNFGAADSYESLKTSNLN